MVTRQESCPADCCSDWFGVFDETVASISKLVSMKSVVKYSEAVALLCDLREALGPDLGPEFTALTAAELRKLFPRTNGLVAKLKEHGFL